MAKEKIVTTKDPLIEAAEHFERLARERKRKTEEPTKTEKAVHRAEFLPVIEAITNEIAAEEADKLHAYIQLEDALELYFEPGRPQPKNAENIKRWIKESKDLFSGGREEPARIIADINGGAARKYIGDKVRNYREHPGAIRELYRKIETATKDLEPSHA